jgi:hypothetical protein
MAVDSQIGVVAPPPIYSATTDKATCRANIDWLRWFNSVAQAFSATAASVGRVSATAQAAAITTTAVNTPSLGTGLYRVNVYARVTVAATTSSSLGVTIQWVDDGVTCSATIGPVTGNLTTTILQGEVIINIDKASVISYATTYASVGATAMAYKLVLSVEDLP